MGMMINRRRVMGGKLPYDAEIEYLESTGTQWIDTGVYVNSNMKAECAFKAIFDNTPIFGARERGLCDDDFDCIAYDYDVYGIIFRYKSQNKIFVPTSNNIRYDIILENGKYTVNGVEYSWGYQGNFQWTKITLYLFARNFGNGDNIYKGKKSIYYFRIFDNNTLVLDLIPVRVGQVGYMYDKVSKQLFGNQGTGSFILGPDKEIKKHINVNVKTHSVGDYNASLDVTAEDGEPVNILYRTARETPWTNGYIQVAYPQGSHNWLLFAITPCLYDGQVYQSGDLIAYWDYRETKDINIVANI